MNYFIEKILMYTIGSESYRDIFDLVMENLCKTLKVNAPHNLSSLTFLLFVMSTRTENLVWNDDEIRRLL